MDHQGRSPRNSPFAERRVEKAEVSSLRKLLIIPLMALHLSQTYMPRQAGQYEKFLKNGVLGSAYYYGVHLPIVTLS